MAHVFLAPHPDDAAFSCGGLIHSIRELGQNVAVVTVFSGGPQSSMTEYQRTALGFGNKAHWPNTEAFRRANIPADVPEAPAGAGWTAEPERMEATQAVAAASARSFWQRASWYRNANIYNAETDDRPLADSVAQHGTLEEVDLLAADASAIRKIEDERFAFQAEASLVWMDLPDAVFRGYEGDAELLGGPRPDDETPYEAIRREILRLEPQLIYVPLGVGNHVYHVHCRNVGLAMLDEARRWVMPGPDMVGRIIFYEDFPYSWWSGFDGPWALPDDFRLPAGVQLQARYSDITDTIERKMAAIRLYSSQVPRLFGDADGLRRDVTGYGAKLAEIGGITGYAERYWGTVRG
jgi:LmbE family N-acetylglucosaminyl deacetylase